MKEAFIKYASNRRLNDKGSLGYMIGMVSSTHLASIYWSYYKRSELLDALFELIEDEDKLLRLLQSDNICKGVSKYC